MDTEYYIISLKWSVRSDHIVFWGPNNDGYTIDLDLAGKYTQEQIDNNRGFYDDGKATLAVPCNEIDLLVRRVVPDERLHDTILKKHGVEWVKVLETKEKN